MKRCRDGASRSEAKKKRLDGCVDIPIVRLNPFGVLDKSRLKEQEVRESGCKYVIMRPCGLKTSDKWPAGRAILSQGDVAAGRATYEDVGEVLAQCAVSDEATGKTFEMFTLSGYPAPVDGYATTFRRLRSDVQRQAAAEDMGFGGEEGGPGELFVEMQYAMVQQLLPGEVQDATRLEMGRTYEQLDAGKVNRAKGAEPTVREKALANRGVGSEIEQL